MGGSGETPLAVFKDHHQHLGWTRVRRLRPTELMRKGPSQLCTCQYEQTGSGSAGVGAVAHPSGESPRGPPHWTQHDAISLQRLPGRSLLRTQWRCVCVWHQESAMATPPRAVYYIRERDSILTIQMTANLF